MHRALSGELKHETSLACRRLGRRPAEPSERLDYAENFLYMLDSMGSTSYRPHPVLARALDVLFTLHAEHEMNCSTAAVRHLASSGVDVYTAIVGGTCSDSCMGCMHVS